MTGDPQKHRVVIIGAGVSGFSAAATLLENDVSDIVVLEASSRIGGRIHTVELGGITVDLGAETINGNVDNAVYELANPQELLASFKPFTHPDMNIYANTSGHIFNTAEINSLANKLYAMFKAEELKNCNGSLSDYFYPRLDEFFRSNNVDTAIGEALRYHIEQLKGVYYAVDTLDQLGASGTTRYRMNEPVSLKWKVGGYKTIFDLISKRFLSPDEIPVQSKILLNKQVTRIEQQGSEVRVETADGSIYLADHVIVTLPLGVLKDEAAQIFHPPLPERKAAAIKALGFGGVVKVFMLFPERWWPTDKNIITPLFSQKELEDFKANSVHGHWSASTAVFKPVISSNRMLCAWISGPSALHVETLSNDEIEEGLMELLNRLLGRTLKVMKPERILRSDWCNNPFFKGTYSYLSAVSDRQNITNDDLRQPILDANDKPVVLFAGEATHPCYQSTVHGAIETGRREANTIIDYLNKL
ncbi:spermine oxidase-like isoform X2 [Homalodisca vitripennis]|uniref:spermine oxidase-like isoform X2 n=1 Tax=Homalodisca vitripennis TaxID=197043 RepID=UPI001EEAAF16|nr:spermine oxidase-like isoform X2 [Homalodisca vitripennis]XP_046658320.1 spermine oxidase-like isoform X2 [Homalodisca vitripennis]